MSQSVSIAHLGSRALIAVGGPDWRGFLQGLITQDVETMAPGEARFGALLTPQGRLLYDLFVVERDGGAWLDVEAALARAQAGLGVIPAEAAPVIAAHARAELFDLPQMQAAMAGGAA